MKKFLVTMVLALSTTAMVAEAWARPMGGKRSFGRQSQAVRQMPAPAPAPMTPMNRQAATPAPAAPVAGAAAGAGVATIAQRLRGTGIDEDFLESVTSHLSPGTSTLLVLSSEVKLDEVRAAIERGIARGDVALLHAELADDAPSTIRDLVRELSDRPLE